MNMINKFTSLLTFNPAFEQVYSINHALQHKLDHSLIHLREDFFRRVIYGIASEDFIRENLSALQLEQFQDDLKLMLLECEGIEALHQTMPASNLLLIFNTLIKETLDGYEDFFVLPLDKNKYGVIFHSISSESLQRLAETVITRIEQDLSLDITACLSDSYRLHELTSALQELLRLSNYQHANANKVLTSQGVKDLLNKNVNHSAMGPASLSNLKHSFLTTFKRCLNSNGKTLNQFTREYPDLLNEFMEVPVSKFSEKTFALFELIFNYCNKDKFSLESSTASQIFMYIHKHFDKDLSLTDIANHFNLSESYVSKLLKNSPDINFKQYVNTLKVKRAKELLHQGNYKVHEVAAIVGCNNTNTFIRIFKQYIGVSPGEYVKNLNQLSS